MTLQKAHLHGRMQVTCGTPFGAVPVPTAVAPPTSSMAVDEAARALTALGDTARVAQLSQVLYGWDLVQRRGSNYVLSDIGRRVVRDGPGVGSVYGLFRADPWSGRDWDSGVVPEARAEVAEMIQEEIRAVSGGIPALIVEEAPHGLQALGAPTLPTLLGQAATWNPELIREASELVSRAARAEGINAVLVSGLDVLRDPRWGRSEECPGESPKLVADIARALVLGFQGDPGGPQLHERAGVVMKHYAGQGDYAGGRNSGSAPIGMRELAEIHLPPCAAAVEAGAIGLMAAYNDIDGVPCVANSWLLDDLLRGTWGWDGVVMADALSVDRLAETMAPEAAALTALTAGLDVNMGDECWASLFDLAADHREVVARAAGRMLRVKARLGLLAEGTSEGAPPPTGAQIDEASSRLAQESITLLHGDLPPVPAGASVVVVGERAADAMVMLGDYVSPRLPGVDCSLATALAGRLGARFIDGAATDLEQRLAAADVVVCQVGGTSERQYAGTFRATGASELTTTATCGEGVDLAGLELPHDQDEFVARVRRATGGRLVVVAIMGRPHVLTEVQRHADDLLLAWYPGPHGGFAIADLLTGVADPQGRLPVTLLSHHGVLPWHDDDRVGRVEPGYVDVDDAALHRVGDGHGRHLTRMDDHELRQTPAGVTVEVTVSADGAGEELLTCFVRRLGSPLWPRRRELLRYARVGVGPMPTTVTFDITADELFGPADTRCILTMPLLDLTVELDRDHEGEP